MTKQEYLKKWAEDIQTRVWEREVFIAFKKAEEKPNEVEIDALNTNNDKDNALLKWINETELHN